MLRAISYGWKQAALAEKAAEVFRLGRELHERLGQMGAGSTSSARALASASTPTTRPSAPSRAGCWSRPAGSATSRSARASLRASVQRASRRRCGSAQAEPSSAGRRPVRGAARPELVAEARCATRLVGPTSRARAGEDLSRGSGSRGLRQRRRLRPVHGPVLRAAGTRCSPTCSELPADGRVLDVGLRAGRPDRRAGRTASARTGSTRSTLRRPFVEAARERAAGRRHPAGRRRVAALRRRRLRRRARPARRALHGRPGAGPGRDGAGHPARRGGRPPASGTTAAGSGPLSPFWSAVREPGPGAVDESRSRGRPARAHLAAAVRPGRARRRRGRRLDVTVALRVVRGLVGALHEAAGRPATTSPTRTHRPGRRLAGACRARLPDGPFELTASAWAARGRGCLPRASASPSSP